MRESLSILILVVFGVLGGISACMARTTEKFLWGAAICSLGLSLAIQVLGGGYYGLMMLTCLLTTDLLLYLFLRTQRLGAIHEAQRPKLDRLIKIFFLWLILCTLVSVAILLFSADSIQEKTASRYSALTLLSEVVWSTYWLVVFIPVVGVLGIVTGGFFLVRSEK